MALISLTVAVGALGYNSWRNEKTEDQRKIRLASFQVLENLGEMQEIVDARYYYLAFEQNTGAELHATWVVPVHKRRMLTRHTDVPPFSMT